MKVINVLLGRAIRIAKIVGRKGGVYLHDANKSLVDRYGFVAVPTKLEEYDESKGVTFRHGKFAVQTAEGPREIVIDTFQVYSNGLLADTRSTTSHADQFLDDVIAWGMKTWGAEFYEGQPIEKLYVSNLEVSLVKPLSAHFPSLMPIGGELSRYLHEYGLKHGNFEAVGINFNFDRSALTSLLSPFSIERREGVPFHSELYFSSAPLKTEDHVALLEKLEKK